jgi:hypothetical protein
MHPGRDEITALKRVLAVIKIKNGLLPVKAREEIAFGHRQLVEIRVER